MKTQDHAQLTKAVERMTWSFLKRFGLSDQLKGLVEDIVQEGTLEAWLELNGTPYSSLPNEEQSILVGRSANKALGRYRRQEMAPISFDRAGMTPRTVAFAVLGKSDDPQALDSEYASQLLESAGHSEPSAEDVLFAADDIDLNADDSIDALIGARRPLTPRQRETLAAIGNRNSSMAEISRDLTGSDDSVASMVRRVRQAVNAT